MNFLKVKNYFKEKYYNWSLDTAVRYLPLVRFLQKTYNDKRYSILEIGSGNTGIAPYINKKVIGLDEYYHQGKAKNIKVIKGNAKNLPFRDSSYDVVISMDMLEHVSPNMRYKTIKEMFRVSKKYILLGFPEGNASVKQDKYVKTLTKKVFDTEDKFIREHIKYGLPTVSEVLKYMSYHQIEKLTILNNFPIILRYMFLYLLFSKKRTYIRIYFVSNFIAGLLSKITIGASYRKILIIEKFKK